MNISPYPHWEQTRRTEDELRYLIEFTDGDRIYISEKELQRACGFADRRRDFANQFGELFRRVDAWVSANLDKIDRVYLSFVPSGVDLIVVQRGRGFDREFNRSLSRFDSSIARDERFSLLELHTLVLPNCEENTVASFVGPDSLMRRASEDDQTSD